MLYPHGEQAIPAFPCFCRLERPRGASRPALPLFPSSLADFIWGQRVVFITTAIWLRFKGSRALRGKGWAGGGGWGTLSLGRGFPAQTSCQDKAGFSIERSSSCVRADCANSIEHDPSARASPANKVIFPNLLRQRGGHFPPSC